MDWKYLFTSFEGRIGRQQMWMGIIVLMVVSLVANVLDMLFGTIDVEFGDRDHRRALRAGLDLSGRRTLCQALA